MKRKCLTAQLHVCSRVASSLCSCSLLNYFGKIERVDRISNYPILLTKGDSKLALYGMGNVRDERLHRTFEQDGVTWEKPQQDPAGWFNLAVVHQNRSAANTSVPCHFIYLPVTVCSIPAASVFFSAALATRRRSATTFLRSFCPLGSTW
jgi:hypothetical protein